PDIDSKPASFGFQKPNAYVGFWPLPIVRNRVNECTPSGSSTITRPGCASTVAFSLFSNVPGAEVFSGTTGTPAGRDAAHGVSPGACRHGSFPSPQSH